METPQWDLQITALSGTTINFTYRDLLALPQTLVTADLFCYGAPIAGGDWQGAKLSDILNQAGMEPSVLSIDFGAKDGYSVSMPIDTAMRSDVIVAYQLNGLPLAETLRLVVPSSNGNVWISMLTSISMSNSPLGESISANARLTPYVPPQTASTTPTVQPLQQQQTQPQTPTATNNKNSTTEPTVPPANVTQIPSEQKMAGQQESILPAGAFYILAIGAVTGLIVAFSLVFRHRKLRS